MILYLGFVVGFHEQSIVDRDGLRRNSGKRSYYGLEGLLSMSTGGFCSFYSQL